MSLLEPPGSSGLLNAITSSAPHHIGQGLLKTRSFVDANASAGGLLNTGLISRDHQHAHWAEEAGAAAASYSMTGLLGPSSDRAR